MAPDGTLYVGGGRVELGGKARTLIRFLPNGTLDTTWLAGGDALLGEPLAMTLDGAGRLLVAHRRYNSSIGQMDHFLVRLTPTGSIDPSFAVVNTASDSINALAVQSDARILIGGDFFRINGASTGPLARLLANGAIDLSFPNLGYRVSSLAVQTDGRILVGGISNQLWRLSPNGAVEAGFPRQVAPTPAFGLYYLRAVTVDSLGRIIVVGPTIYRLLPDGTNDLTFTSPTINSEVTAMVVQPNDRIVFNENGRAPQRLLEDGSPDPTFTSAAVTGGEVRDLTVSPTGDLFISGYFAEVDGVPQRALAKLFGGVLPVFTVASATLELAERPGPAATVTILRKGRSDLAASVRLGTVDGTAIGGADFAKLDQRLVFAPGVLSRTVTVPIFDDAEYEGIEQFQLALDEPEDSELGAAREATARITDDPAGAVAFRERAVRVDEGAGTATLTLLRTGGSEGTLTVRVSVVGGTAEEQVDFTLPAGSTISFPPGVTSQALVVPLFDDDLLEPAETFVLRLDEPSPGSTVGAVPEVTATITDNDTLGERAGTYTGVFRLPGLGADQLTRLSISVRANGVVTGRLSFGPRSLAVRGFTLPDGSLTLNVPSSRSVPEAGLQLRLSGALAGPTIDGTVEQGGVSGALALQRHGVFGRATPPTALGRWAVALPPASDAAFPPGWGSLAVEVKNSGLVLARGRLADGSALFMSAPLSATNEAVLYAAPRSGGDRFSAVLSFANTPGSRVTGEFTWVRSAAVQGGMPSVHSAAIRGSATSFAIALPASGQLRSYLGGIIEPVVFPFTQPRAGQFLFPARAASLQFTRATGQFTGRIIPATAPARPAVFHGIWLPEEGRGYGAFLPPASGTVELAGAE